jgi:hypothetical protein
MSFATTAAGTTSVNPEVRLPDVATAVPLVIATYNPAIAASVLASDGVQRCAISPLRETQ